MTVKYRLYRTKESIIERYWLWRSHKAYKASMEFYKKYNKSDNLDIAKTHSRQLMEDWHKCFKTICWSFGINKHDANFLFENLIQFNWKKLHPNDYEEEQQAEHWIEKLASDVFYCSDRWSMDRLMRNHWRYRMAISRLHENEDVEEW